MRLDFSPYRGRRVWPRRWQQHVCRCLDTWNRSGDIQHGDCYTHREQRCTNARAASTPVSTTCRFLISSRAPSTLSSPSSSSSSSSSPSFSQPFSSSSSFQSRDFLASSDNFFISEMKLFVSLKNISIIGKGNLAKKLERERFLGRFWNYMIKLCD